MEKKTSLSGCPKAKVSCLRHLGALRAEPWYSIKKSILYENSKVQIYKIFIIFQEWIQAEFWKQSCVLLTCTCINYST